MSKNAYEVLYITSITALCFVITPKCIDYIDLFHSSHCQTVSRTDVGSGSVIIALSANMCVCVSIFVSSVASIPQFENYCFLKVYLNTELKCHIVTAQWKPCVSKLFEFFSGRIKCSFLG